jgi:transposase
MNSLPCIGVDVAQATLAIAVEGQTSSLEIANTVRAVRHWLSHLKSPCRIGLESTSHYHQLLAREALAAGHVVYVLNARDLSHYAQSVGRRAKTDRLDAQLIARYLAREYEHLHPYQLPTVLQTQLEELIGRRHAVVVAQVALRQSFSAMRQPPAQLQLVLQALTALIAQIDAQLQALVQQDPTLHTAAQHLRTVVGFGPLLSSAMVTALNHLPFQHADAFVAYVGLDPRVRDSGQWRGRRRLSKRGPAELRRLLFVAAMSASKTSLWRPIYERYRARGLSSTTTLVILARKLARIAYSIAKYGTDFNPQLIQQIA